MITLSVVTPVYNEEFNIEEFYHRTKETLKKIPGNHEIIFVDDGSTDQTFNILKNLCINEIGISLIKLNRNFGHQKALYTGMCQAQGLAIITLDSDLQDPPELIEDLYQKWLKGSKIVYAKRTSRQGESYFKKITANIFYRFLQKLIPFEVPLDVGDYRLLDQVVLKTLKNMPEKIKFLRGQIAWTGFRHDYAYFNRDARKNGTTKYSVLKMLQFATDGITSFSVTPLHVIYWLSLLFGSLTLISLLIQLTNFDYLQLIIPVILFSTTTILISLSLMSLYLGRIFQEIKNRPDTTIDNENSYLNG